jgi:hypothetical protein
MPLLPGSSQEGRLVDVSAGGVRVAATGPAPLGMRLRLEVRLADPGDPTGPPRLVLDGTGAIVWGSHADAAPDFELGIAFDEPLAVRRPFPEVRVF